VNPDVHLERHRADRGLRLPELAKGGSHPERGIARPHLVLLAGEEQQERVAAELEEPAAEGVGDVEEPGEDEVHHLGDLLRAAFPSRGEALRHRREARDVDEDERSLELAPPGLGSLAQPIDDDPGDERRQVDYRRGFRCRHHQPFDP